MHMNADDYIKKYAMRPHEEGGYYREIWQSPTLAADGTRSCASMIYYLLRAGEISRYHRLSSDELWLHLDGGIVTVTLSGSGETPVAEHHLLLGHDTHHVLIPAHTWQTATGPDEGFALLSCVVSPGFRYEDWELL